jgi:type II secretory pathway pseudopilin PulG
MSNTMPSTQPKTLRKPSQPGFTLIELLLYVAISAMLLGGLVTLLLLLMNARIKNQTVGEVEGQSTFAMEEIGQSIRNSASITAPAPAASASTLTLGESDSSKDPTTFALTAGAITDTEGKGSAVPLTSPAIAITGLTFTNVSLAASTSQSIRVSFTATYINKTGRSEYDYSKTFYDTFSLR